MKNPEGKIKLSKNPLSLPFILICGVIGFFIAWGLLEKVADGSFAWWHSLGTPPEQLRSIAGFFPYADEDSVDIYVEATNGSIYLRHKNSETWERASLPQDLYKYPCYENDVVKQPYFANLPARVVDCYQVLWSSEWVTNKTYFVILEDNSIWQWHDRVDFTVIFSFLCGGPIIGLVIGWGLAKIAWRRYQKMLQSSAT